MVSRFRVKKLSPKHPLPIYKEYQLPDLHDTANIQREVPQIETGVEKEEEEEHDLQAAISAAHAAVTTGATVETYIPTPDASRLIPHEEYATLYKKKYKEPSTFIRFSSTVEDSIGCPYVMDEEDESFLQDYNKNHPGEVLSEDMFEKIMWEFESIANQQWPHLDLDPSHVPEFKSFLEHVPDYNKIKTFPNLELVYNHWGSRKQKRGGKSIIPQLRYEDTTKSEASPYVCFRRRETKPARKTRRTDQQSLERLRKLRSEMEMARNLLEMVLRREKIRKESLVLEHSVFDKRKSLEEYQRILGIKEDDDLLFTPPPKKKRSTEGSSGATIKIPLHRLRKESTRIEKTPTQLAIEAELARRKELDRPYEDVTDKSYQPFSLSTPQLFFQPLSSAGGKHKYGEPKYRKRVGRGGRVFLDRIGFSPANKPNQHDHSGHPVFNRHQFDSDISDDEDTIDIDEMESLYLKHRVQLLSENELRSLVTVPFLTPLNMININQARSAAAAISNHSTSTPPSIPPTRTLSNQQQSPLPPSPVDSVVSTSSANAHIKRQNSRTKMTPQQAAVAMANGMIAANMAAAVNGASNTNKAAMQMAMAQFNNGN